MKSRLFLLVCMIVFVSINFAQTKSTIRLKNIGQAKISITKGKLLSEIDLSDNVAGCAYVTNAYKKILDNDKVLKGCESPPANFKLIDSTEKDDFIYLIVWSEAMGNCNVCGHGGGTNSFSLIWLKLADDLKVIEKKSVDVEWYRNDIAVTKPKPKAYYNLSIWKPIFIKDLMTIEFEKTNYKDNGDILDYDFSHLEYSRKTPEKAFVIRTSKLEKSTLDN
jgi:hypothetical protein